MRVIPVKDLPPVTGEMPTEVDVLAGKISELLGGRDPRVVDCALADVLAMFIAGLMVMGDKEATEKMREEWIEMHLHLVRTLVPVCERQILRRLRKEGAS